MFIFFILILATQTILMFLFVSKKQNNTKQKVAEEFIFYFWGFCCSFINCQVAMSSYAFIPVGVLYWPSFFFSLFLFWVRVPLMYHWLAQNFLCRSGVLKLTEICLPFFLWVLELRSCAILLTNHFSLNNF